MKRVGRSGRYVKAHLPFFLAAALFALLWLPLWLYGRAGGLADCAGCDPIARHGHEMLFGYALAVVGGFLFTKLGRGAVAVALGCWLLGRAVVVLGLPPSPLTAAAALAFPLCVLVLAGLPFWKAARTAHNRVFAPVLGAFTLAELLYQAGALGLVVAGERRGVMLGLDLVALLLFIMGGRVLAAATAGALRAQGRPLIVRVQPRVEWIGIAALAAALVLDLARAEPAANAAAALAGVATLWRLARWQPWLIRRRHELWPLHLGYGWLGAGLLLEGVGAGLGLIAPAAALHALTVGALGTLTLTMMTRTLHQRGGRAPFAPPAFLAALAAINLAAVLRVGGQIEAAGLAWVAAFALFLAVLAPALRPLSFPSYLIGYLRRRKERPAPPWHGGEVGQDPDLPPPNRKESDA